MTACRSQVRATSGRTPSPSAPTTSASGPRRSSAPIGWAVGAVATAQLHSPAAFSSSSARTRLGTRAIGISSVAPALLLVTVPVTSVARCSGMITPVAPNRYAERTIAPRLCGSWMPSSTTTSGDGAAASASSVA